MSQPILTRNLRVINIASNTSTNSAAVDISDCTIVGLQAIATGAAGTVAGSIQFQASQDNGTTWTNIGTALSVPASFASGVATLTDAPWSLIRVAFTALGGTGPALTSLQVFVVTKQPA
jgi:hypothetical protein